MKLLFFIPIWRRPEITKIFIEKMNFSDYCESRVLFIVSPNDPDYNANIKLINRFDYFVTENNTLGQKKNAGLNHALGFDWDFLIEFGSDNIWNPELWQIYKPLFKKFQYFGINNIYVLEINKNKALFLENYHESNALGVGRVISRKIIESVGRLWRDDWNCGMDGCSNFAIENKGIKNHVVETGERFILLDIKSDVNLTGFYEIENKGKPVDPEIIKEKFNLKINIEPKYFRTIEIKEFHQEVEVLTQSTGNKRVAFDSVNVKYQTAFGKKRFKNYESYQSFISKKYKEWKN